MNSADQFDVIIVGGSYSGLAAGMALGRARRKVLILDSGVPCNRQTPHSHNFLTQDGRTPAEIATLARQQVERYPSVEFMKGVAVSGGRLGDGFSIATLDGGQLKARKLIFATGIRDVFPDLPGLAECWGISVLHCPYCHGYEIRDETTGVLGNGDYALEFTTLVSNWTSNLTVFTNGIPLLSPEQIALIRRNNIRMEEKQIARLEHVAGRIQRVVFHDGSHQVVNALYTRVPFEQHCTIPDSLGCQRDEQGYYITDATKRTSEPGIFAAGDNSSPLRTVAQAVAAGTTAGMMVNKELTSEEFNSIKTTSNHEGSCL